MTTESTEPMIMEIVKIIHKMEENPNILAIKLCENFTFHHYFYVA
jgi:hypothetical protein